MPRRRMIAPEIWRNPKIGRLSDAGRLLFIGIFSQADDDGRLRASPDFLMANIFPYDKDKTEEDIRRLRDQCAALGLIRVYTNSKEEYLDIPGWQEHQQIRSDRYKRSSLPGFDAADNQVATNDNQPTTSGCPNIIESNLISPPKGGQRKTLSPTKKEKKDSRVNEIFAEMRNFLVCGGEAVPAIKESSAMTADRRIDPIPSYGKEGTAIKRMLTRGFTREEIIACWKSKVSQRGGEFVSMHWVNEDIGKKGGTGETHKRESAGGKPKEKWDPSKPLR